jgi:hypothetical protein
MCNDAGFSPKVENEPNMMQSVLSLVEASHVAGSAFFVLRSQGLSGRFPHLSLTKLKAAPPPTNIQFDPLSWICPITEAVLSLSDESGNDVELPWECQA